MRRSPPIHLFLFFISIFATDCLGDAAVRLNGRKAVTVPVGARMILDAYTWASVGLEGRCEISRPEVVEPLGSDVRYDYFNDAVKGMPGSDEGVRQFEFVAVAKGTTRIHVIEKGRGNDRSVWTVSVTVE
jgi:hypothetical protein